eukprot:scaffold16133_cov69-Phaeocystis_antarctica.AAC.1
MKQTSKPTISCAEEPDLPHALKDLEPVDPHLIAAGQLWEATRAQVFLKNTCVHRLTKLSCHVLCLGRLYELHESALKAIHLGNGVAIRVQDGRVEQRGAKW